MKNDITLMSIITYYAKQIFNGTKKFEFRKSALKEQDLNKTIYVYSAKDDKAIIGSFEVSKVHQGNLQEILNITGYDKRNDKNEIIDYFKNTKTCYALELNNIKLFSKKLTLSQMRNIYSKVQLPQYFTHISNEHPLYETIKNLK